MTIANDDVLALAQLDEASFYALDDELAADRLWTLADLDFRGIVLSAPPLVSIDERDRLPVALLRQLDARRRWDAHPEHNVALVAIDLDTGEPFVGPALRPDKPRRRERESSRRGDAPQGHAAAGLLGNFDVVDVRRIAALPWRARRLAITCLYWDQPSNTVVTTLVGGGSASATEAAAEKETETETETEPSRPAPVVLRPASSTEDLGLGRPGTSLRVVSRGAAAGPSIGGCVRLTAPPTMFVARQPDAACSKPPVVRATLLVAQHDSPAPCAFELQIPLASSPDAGAEVRASFALEIQALELLPGEYMLYLAAGEHVSGPQPIAVEGPSASTEPG